MGMIVSVYRDADSHDCTNGGVTARAKRLCVVNADGPFNPTPDAPAVRLEQHVKGCLRLVPVEGGSGVGPMAGGNYAGTSDSRFGAACEKLLGHRFYGLVSVHDRFESQELHDALST